MKLLNMERYKIPGLPWDQGVFVGELIAAQSQGTGWRAGKLEKKLNNGWTVVGELASI